jgi:hypothetical protein
MIKSIRKAIRNYLNNERFKRILINEVLND